MGSPPTRVFSDAVVAKSFNLSENLFLMKRLLCLFLAMMLPTLSAVAHTVPTIVLESEFTSGRSCTLTVNVDPRLFLSEQPTSLPPVAASWFLDQDDAAKKKTTTQAADYVAKSLHLSVGETEFKPAWEITAIDSASATPLAATSAEVHLLARWKGPIPAVKGDFKAALDPKCAVSLIVLNGTEGRKERRPQVIFPGETSRGYALPELVNGGAATAAISGGVSQSSGGSTGRGHLPYDHLALVVVLAMTLSRRPGAALGFLTAFHLLDTAALTAAVAGWLPTAPGWMKAAYWGALLLALAGLFSPRKPGTLVAAALMVAGLCHGANVPHFHLAEGLAATVTAVAWGAVADFARQALVLLLCLGVLALVRRLGAATGRVSSVAV